MKVVIAGSRGINDPELLRKAVFKFQQELGKITTVICGEAPGSDTLGRKWAEKREIPVQSFFAEWSLFGRGAGFVRNEDMAEVAEAGLFLWDGKSNGTRHMIGCLEELGKPYLIMYTSGYVEICR